MLIQSPTELIHTTRWKDALSRIGAGFIVVALLMMTGDTLAQDPLPERVQPRLYDADPTHPCNRVHRALFVRTDRDGAEHGHEQLDVLLWPTTSRHLLTGDSHEAAVAALRALIAADGASATINSAARALLQRDLWAAFD